VNEGATTELTEPKLGFERLVFFSDAVMAIVITLLVLPLTAELEVPAGGADLLHDVLSRWPEVLSFVVTFLVIGQFWIAHHRMFEHLRSADQGLLWCNLVFLLTVSFLPFPSALLGRQESYDDRFPVVFYALSMFVASTALTATWLYAVARRLVTDPRSPGVRTFTARSLATTTVFLLSIAAAFSGIAPAVLAWTVLIPVVRLLLGRFRAAAS
jgi:TMEM175 potassium channel family protein